MRRSRIQGLKPMDALLNTVKAGRWAKEQEERIQQRERLMKRRPAQPILLSISLRFGLDSSPSYPSSNPELAARRLSAYEIRLTRSG